MPNLVLGSTTVISESGGTATLEVPVSDQQYLPKGITQGVGFLLHIDDGGDSYLTGQQPGGTGDRIIVWHLYGVREYGDSRGNGSELSNKSDTEVSLGFTFAYAHATNGTNDGLMSPGILRVTSAKQRYCIQYHNQNSSYHSWNGITVNTTTDVCIRSWASFIKIG